jgi:hypothetical protein
MSKTYLALTLASTPFQFHGKPFPTPSDPSHGDGSHQEGHVGVKACQGVGVTFWVTQLRYLRFERLFFYKMERTPQQNMIRCDP